MLASGPLADGRTRSRADSSRRDALFARVVAGCASLVRPGTYVGADGAQVEHDRGGNDGDRRYRRAGSDARVLQPLGEIGRAHVWTPVTPISRMPASACKTNKTYYAAYPAACSHSCLH